MNSLPLLLCFTFSLTSGGIIGKENVANSHHFNVDLGIYESGYSSSLK